MSSKEVDRAINALVTIREDSMKLAAEIVAIIVPAVGLMLYFDRMLPSLQIAQRKAVTNFKIRHVYGIVLSDLLEVKSSMDEIAGKTAGVMHNAILAGNYEAAMRFRNEYGRLSDCSHDVLQLMEHLRGGNNASNN